MKSIFQRSARLILLLTGLGTGMLLQAQMSPAERIQLAVFKAGLEARNAQNQARLVQEAARLGFPLRVQSDDRELILRGIHNGLPVYDGNYNLNSIVSASADNVKAGGSLGLGLTGAGITLGIWEAFEPGSSGAVRLSHQEFGGRAVQADGAANLSSHATHVAGTMIAAGTSANAEGFSTGADLQCFDINNDLAEMAAAALAATPVQVSNHSYGSFAGWDSDAMGNWTFYGGANNEDWKFGAYNDDARDWDQTAFNAPFLLIVKSAGNDGNDGPGMNVNHTHFGNAANQTDNHEDDGGADGFDCVPTYGNAKNIVTVGAVNDVAGGYGGPGSVTLAGFSSVGPADDGRIKPDVVANGVSLFSCDEDADDDYTTKGGTSMAAPSVSGSAGLLLEHWQNRIGGTPRAATTKGLLIHMADECGAGNGPDYTFGWGMVNVSDAAELITIEGMEGCQQFVEGSVAAGGTFSINLQSSGMSALKATLVWSDPASAVVNNNTVNPAGVRYLVNDLDLRIEHSGTNFMPWVLDPANPANAATTGDNDRDNAEQVLLLDPESGVYTVNVIAPAALTNGPQQFTLWFSGNDAMDINRTVSGVVLNTAQTFAVQQNLTFGPAVDVVSPANIRAFAGNSVRLVPGFHAHPGAVFQARIVPGGGCGLMSGALKTDNYPGIGFGQEISVSRAAEDSDRSDPASSDLAFSVVPNPASSFVELAFELQEPGAVDIRLLDRHGRIVRTFAQTVAIEAGMHRLRFELGDLPPGAYYCMVQTGVKKGIQPVIVQRL